MVAAGAREREIERGKTEDKMGEDGILEDCFCKYLSAWASSAGVVCLGPRIKQLTRFRDLNERFESLET